MAQMGQKPVMKLAYLLKARAKRNGPPRWHGQPHGQPAQVVKVSRSDVIARKADICRIQ
jgi:hypothetical protein